MAPSLPRVEYLVVSLRDLCWDHCFISSMLMTFLCMYIDNHIYLFADDNKLYARIADLDDCYQLQSDLDLLILGHTSGKFPSGNTSKCKSMHLGKSNPYGLDNEAIQLVNEEKDLGIVFDNQLKFHTHMHTALVVSKANRILALINWCFDTLDSKSFVTRYKTLVHLILEYGNVICGPHYQGDIIILESVQWIGEPPS